MEKYLWYVLGLLIMLLVIEPILVLIVYPVKAILYLIGLVVGNLIGYHIAFWETIE